MNSPFLRCVVLFFIHCTAFASENSSVFYPLPFQQQGQFIIAKQLFSGPAGGLWIHDVHGQLRFFDGQHVLPRAGSVFERPVEDVAYLNNYFWYAQGNQVYRFKPTGSSELMLSLGLGRNIEKVGASGRYLWMAGKEHFYTYDTRSAEFKEYPLTFVYQRTADKEVVINQALFLYSKWVLATSSGTYLSNGAAFEHIKASGQAYVESIHFSPKRRELVIGTLKGAKVINIDHPGQVRSIEADHVLTIEETDVAYWLGTENGIYAYRFLDNDVTHIGANYQDDYALPGNHIYDLLNDGQGGIWVSTNKGINYFSLFSRLFDRVRFGFLDSSLGLGNIRQVLSLGEQQYWIATDQGLYQFEPAKMANPKQVVSGSVNDVVRQGNKLWIAMDTGLYQYYIEQGQLKRNRFPSQLQQRRINQLTIDQAGALWVATDSGLLRYAPRQSITENLGYDWVTDKYSTSKITHLYSSQDGTVWIGTDHGSYAYRNGEIRLEQTSRENAGQILDMVRAQNGNIWTISSYGLSRYDVETQKVIEIPLYETDIKPLCVVSTDKGIWLSTSKGLSFYSVKGELNRHFGAPFGLVNNEFLPGVCGVDPDLSQLIFGSKLGVIYASETELLAAELPSSQVRVGQVQLDMKTVGFAPDSKGHYVFPHGRAITVAIGVLPDFDIWSLEYRLLGSANEAWTKFRGSQLTIDYLLPGDYELEIRTDSVTKRGEEPARFEFTVQAPWFMSGWFVLLASMSVLIVIGLFFYWRSRQIWGLNRKLKDKVELRTSQLKHQSDALLYSNVQLKKQLNTRQSFVDVLALDAFTQLSQLSIVKSDAPDKHYFQHALIKLQQIMHLKTRSTEKQTVFELNNVCDAVLLAMQDDITRHGASLEFVSMVEAEHIEVCGFNLDLVLHGILYNALRRCKKGDSIRLCLATGTEGAGFVVTDSGRGFAKQEILAFSCIDKSELSGHSYALNDYSLAAIRQFVAFGGGECRIFKNAKQENEVEVLWPMGDSNLAYQTQNIAPSGVTVIERKAPVEEPQDPWLIKVQDIVDAHFHDAEFGTAQMAKLLFTSERSLQRKFKSHTGKTFKEYLNEVRLEQACQLLISGHKVSDVAFDSGFNDPSYFSQRFKHHYGISPSKFIESTSDSV